MPNTQAHGRDRDADAHRAWLVALARRLASNEADAEDLVQETLLVGRDAPGAPDEPSALRRWLGAVLRNRERMARRAEGRRRLREAQVDPQDVEVDVEQAAHRRRVLTSLREALDELDADERALLLTRYCDDVPAPEIAARLGLPASTVRTRLGRATSRMRARLDERWGGDRRGWVPAVLVSLPDGSGGAAQGSAGWWVGGLWMASKATKWWLLLVVVLAGAGTWWMARRSEPVQGETSAAAARSDDAELAGRLQARRRGLEPESAAALRGVVVDATTKRPIPDAVVALAPRTGMPLLGRRGASLPHARTTASGEFSIDTPAGEYHLTAAAAGFAPTTIERVHVGDDAVRTIALVQGGVRVEGVLTDITGGEIEGAMVVAQPQGLLRRGVPAPSGVVATSDADGRYVLWLGEGRWSLEAGGDDYARERRRVSVRRAAARVDFQLVPAATIEGRVVDRATGAPVVDATVGFERFVSRGRGFSMDSAEPDEGARTDATGAFELRGLSPGDYSLFATARSRASASDAAVTVGFGEQVDGVVVMVDPAFDVSGFVVDEADREQGLAGVGVMGMQMQPPRRWIAMTDEAGYFELLGVPAGVLPLGFRGDGIVASYLEQSITIGPDGPAATPGIFVVERGVTVAGHVIDPPPGTTVTVVPRPRTGGLELLAMSGKVAGAQARVAEDGSFTIPGVPPGQWRITASADDGSAGEVEIDVGAAGQDDVSITIAPRTVVRGVVVDGDGRALSGVSAVLVADDEVRSKLHGASPDAGVTTDAEGRFEIVGAEPGRWGVSVFDAGGQTLVQIGDPSRVVIEPGAGVVEMSVRAELPQGRITGIVVDPEGSPIADAWVDASPGSPRPTVTDAEGRFELTGLADGEYRIDVRGDDDGSRGEVVDVAPGADVRVELSAPCAVRGTVSMGGATLERFAVTAGPNARPRSFISADGSFAIDRLRAGEQTITASSDDGAAIVTITLEPGQTLDVPIELGAWGRIRGRLVSASDGAPQGGIAVTARAESAQRGGGRMGIGALIGGGPTSNDAGVFEVDGLGPGAIELQFTRGRSAMGGVALGRFDTTLAPGETLDVGDVVVLPTVEVSPAARGWFGFESNLAVRPSGESDGADSGKHVWIVGVSAGSPAAVAGLRAGDRIESIDGLTAAKLGAATLLDALRPARLEIGTTHELVVTRDGAALPFSVEVVAQ